MVFGMPGWRRHHSPQHIHYITDRPKMEAFFYNKIRVRAREENSESKTMEICIIEGCFRIEIVELKKELRSCRSKQPGFASKCPL